MVSSALTMGCVQSKTVTRQLKPTNNGTTLSNGVARQPAYEQDNSNHDDTDARRNIDLDMRSPRICDTTSGLPNGNPRADTIESLEDHEPIGELPDTMTICTVSDKHTSLSISNVSLKQRDSAQSRGLTSSQFSTDLSIEELDTEMDDFSKLRPGARYIHRPGDRINPPTTDILLPRRKETPYPTEVLIDTTNYIESQRVIPRNKATQEVINEEKETSVSKTRNVTASSVSVKDIKRYKKNTKKKSKQAGHHNKILNKVLNEINSEKTLSNSKSEEGTIKINSMEAVEILLKDDQTNSSNEPDFVDGKSDTKTDQNILPQHVKIDTNPNEESGVFVFNDDPKARKLGVFLSCNEVKEATREVVKDFLKETDVSKVEVNTVFKNHIEREKARAARKRKRDHSKANKKDTTSTTQQSKEPSHDEIGRFFGRNENPEPASLKFRAGSRTSLVSIASMNPTDSEFVFDQSADTSGIVSENTMDEFSSEAKLVDIEDEFGTSMSEGMDDKSLHSTTSVNSIYGIKPYKATPQPINPDNCSLRDIGFEVNHEPSSSNTKTKQKLIHSRHARRPMSESVLRIAGKPPIPPSHLQIARPHSDTVPRGARGYSRYMTVDTDLF